MNHDNHSCMIREMFPERVKHIQSIVDMLPRKAVPVLSLEQRQARNTKCNGQTATFRIQTYSKRILLNTPRIQDSRFKVQGKVLPGTLNLESWIRGVFNRIRFEYV